MRISSLFASVALAALMPAFASAQDAAPTADAPAVEAEADQGEIIVTATRRNEALSDVPIAVSAISATSLENSGAADIRQLNQLSPSLLVSSTSSEAAGGAARIRGIGTVGDNAGLESSVGTFIDGVYRSRSGTALTELGAVERIEVLRGPQGTLFGRNTSAGLINVVTKKPSFETEGSAAFTYGNYDAIRAEAGFTGPILGGDTVAMRVDGVYFKRDGFLRDVISGRDINDRDRWLVRGQLLVRPNDDLEIRIIGDYADRKEECCGAIYQPLTDRVRAPGTPAGQIGDVSTVPSSFAPVLRSFTDSAGNRVFLNDDITRREQAITPGRNYQQDVRDWGISGEVNWEFGAATLTSITAYRDYTYDRSQDADFNNLDIFYRDGVRTKFETFSQELRLQGEAFNGKLNWLVGGYFADEDLTLRDRLRFGADWDRYSSLQLAATPGLGAFPQFGFARLQDFIGTLLPAQVRPALLPLIANVDITDVGESSDDFKQNSRNFALFTHNQIQFTDWLGLTLGLRYTNEEKTLDATLLSDNLACQSIRDSAGRLRAFAATPGLPPALAGAATSVAGQLFSPTSAGLSTIPCLVNLNTTIDGDYDAKKKEGEFTGTAVLTLKPIDKLLIYGSYSRGYKAGGFNLDRQALTASAPNVSQLPFEAETVNAFELGAKFNGRQIDLNVAVFRQEFENFQLNQFNGLAFAVENFNGCKSEPGAPAAGQVFGACPTGDTGVGVTSTGVEVEAFLYPARNFQMSAGVTYAETKYKQRIVGAAGRALSNDFFQLPGQQISNAPELVATASATWTPDIGDAGWSGLLYADTRLQSEYNTGSDLDPEKQQQSIALVNARIGVRGPEQRFSVEFWGQNIFNVNYTQIGFDAPLQPIGGPGGGRVVNRAAGSAFAVNRSSALFGRFLAEPRTYGVTVRTRF